MTKTTPERRNLRYSVAFIVKFELTFHDDDNNKW